jgi:hypothetical protein
MAIFVGDSSSNVSFPVRVSAHEHNRFTSHDRLHPRKETHMKTNRFVRLMLSIISVFFLSVLFLSLLFSSSAIAQGKGKGGGGSGGGGSASPPDLGDLFVLYRDADGVPILTPDSCQQPLAAPGVALPAVGSIPACLPSSPTASCLIPVDPATCAVVTGYETFTQEVDFGRNNVVRSPASVLETQLGDAIVNLATADCVTLDPAGRMVASTVADGIVSSATVDSPLQSLAIYRQLMLTGYLGAAPLTLPAGPLATAARALGASSDKEGKVGVDMVVYLNQILGLTDQTVTTFLPKKCILVKEEVKGVVQMVQKCFLLYGSYAYSRSANFGALPSPPYIPAAGPLPGWFEYLAVFDLTPTFYIAQGPILPVIPEFFGNQMLTASNISGFAQAADDTRAVIEFMHTWPVPGDYSTPLACTASGETLYDVSISNVSGLQVPVRMVAGTEGREFTLTVANAGPSPATGTATVTAKDATGVSIPTFPRVYPFTILAGASQSWTEGFSVNFATTVTWTAVATATSGTEANPGNNSVTATTRVTGSGGGQSSQ